MVINTTVINEEAKAEEDTNAIQLLDVLDLINDYPKKDKILTFRDMSHLSYFVSNQSSQKKQQRRYSDELKSGLETVKEVSTTEGIILDLLDDILDLAMDIATNNEEMIVNDKLIENNYA
jgi:hypothetical protein